MKQRIAGFDLARAYAVFGMFVVNFNIVFGSHTNTSLPGRFLNLFNGNSSTTFVILAGMGVALMSNRKRYSGEEKKALRRTLLRRSWFLFFTGLALYTWWPADILHFYGGYMHAAALLLFVPKRFYLWAGAAVVIVFHLLFVIVSYESGWDFTTLTYTDFWTVPGFLRNTFYNGWNPIFPWLGFFLLGMYLARLNWSEAKTRKRIFITGFVLFLTVEGLQWTATLNWFTQDLTFYLTADYLPPFLPFMLGTSAFTAMLLPVCVVIGSRFQNSAVVRLLSQTGQMTLTHYIVHLTLGMVLLGAALGRGFEAGLNKGEAASPLFVLLFAAGFFGGSVAFSYVWRKRFAHGPFEALMRWASGSR